MHNRGWAAAVIGVGALVPVLAACGSAGSNTNAGAAYGGSGMGATPSSSAMGGSASGMGTRTTTLTIKSTKIGKVLADAKGDTLYWYSKDAKDGPSTCTGSCLKEWPMAVGKAVAAPGVKLAGELGGITDAGGAIQASYNGYPLYTYAGDMAPGDTAGNDEGGVWHVITGSTLTTVTTGMGSSGSKASPAPTKAAGGYGYGYGAGVPVSSGSSSGSSSSSSSSSGGSADSQRSSAHPGTTTAPAPASAPSTAAPAPAPTSSINGGGCGEGACW